MADSLPSQKRTCLGLALKMMGALPSTFLRCAANEALASRRPEVPPFSLPAMAIRVFY